MSNIIKKLMTRPLTVELHGIRVEPGDLYGNTHGVVAEVSTQYLMSNGNIAYTMKIEHDPDLIDFECECWATKSTTVTAILTDTALDVIATGDLDKYELDKLTTPQDTAPCTPDTCDATKQVARATDMLKLTQRHVLAAWERAERAQTRARFMAVVTGIALVFAVSVVAFGKLM